MSEIMVSVCCTVYNHEKYLRQCLDGFVMQKTNFPFEVIVHDDASTDRSADIIREYAEKYPEIIKPIYQKENQYSQHIPIMKTFIYPKMQGKYIAFCEGDDRWIDSKKLQKQFDYMEEHPICTLCFTNGRFVYKGIDSGRVIPRGNAPYYKPGNSDYNFSEMLFLDYVPTASLFLRSEIELDKPTLPKEAFSGDTYTRLYATSKGYAHCIDEDTCVYNFGVENSFLTKCKEDKEFDQMFLYKSCNLLLEMDKITDGQYHDDLMRFLHRKRITYAVSTCDYKLLREKKYRDFFRKEKSFSAKFRLKGYTLMYFPKLYPTLLRLSRKMRGIDDHQ